MADESNTAKGVRGRLPVWPRNALNPSVIAAEQAYRKRSGLPLLTDPDIEALKAGQPLWWETEGGTPPPDAVVAATNDIAAPVAPAAPVAAAPAAPESTTISDEVKAMVAAGIPDGMVPGVLPILLTAHSVRAQLRFQDRVSLRVRAWRGHQVPAEISHLGRPHAGSHVRDLRALHASGMHAGLEAQREQIQVSVPRQRIRQRRN
jgi:hypothetical protein